jgi:predicted nucleic acid-binding protein
MLFLDNDVLAKFARPDPDPAVVDYLKQLESEVVDAITPIDSGTSLEAATIESLLADAGTSLDTGDLLVAATARQHDGTLAAANENDFDKAPIHQLIDVDIVATN